MYVVNSKWMLKLINSVLGGLCSFVNLLWRVRGSEIKYSHIQFELYGIDDLPLLKTVF
jgi:hypothetical protein